MYSTRWVHTRQLIALLLLAVMVLIHIVKGLHTHAYHSTHHHCVQANILATDDGPHSCTICDFQLAKDCVYTGSYTFVGLPVLQSPIYCRILSNLNADYFFFAENRGPPQV